MHRKTLMALAATALAAPIGMAATIAPAVAAPAPHVTAAPATTSSAAYGLKSSDGTFLFYPDGSGCTDGAISLTVTWDRSSDFRLGRITRIEAHNGSSGTVVEFSSLYVRRWTGSRAESYNGALGYNISPGDNRYMGGGGQTHKLPFKLIGHVRNARHTSCKGTIVVGINNN